MGACCSSYKTEKEERNDIDRYNTTLRMSIAESRKYEDSANIEKIMQLKSNVSNHSTSPHLLFAENFEELSKYYNSQRHTIEFKWISVEDIWNLMAENQYAAYQSNYIVYNHHNTDLNVSSSFVEDQSDQMNDRLFVSGLIKLYKIGFYNVFCRFKQLSFDLTKHLSNDIKIRVKSFLDQKKLIILLHQTSFGVLDIILSKIANLNAQIEVYVAAFDCIKAVSQFEKLMSNEKETALSNIKSICQIPPSDKQQLNKFGVINSNYRILSLLDLSLDYVVPYLLINLDTISWLNSQRIVYLDKKNENGKIDTEYACLVKKLSLKVVNIDLTDFKLKKGFTNIKQSKINLRLHLTDIRDSLLNSDSNKLILLENWESDIQIAGFIIYFLHLLTGIPAQQLGPFITDNPFCSKLLGCKYSENDYQTLLNSE